MSELAVQARGLKLAQVFYLPADDGGGALGTGSYLGTDTWGWKVSGNLEAFRICLGVM